MSRTGTHFWNLTRPSDISLCFTCQVIFDWLTTFFNVDNNVYTGGCRYLAFLCISECVSHCHLPNVRGYLSTFIKSVSLLKYFKWFILTVICPFIDQVTLLIEQLLDRFTIIENNRTFLYPGFESWNFRIDLYFIYQC